MRYKVAIRDNSTQEVRDIDYNVDLEDPDGIVAYQFEAGNMSCDCNLHREFGGLEYEDSDHPCGETAYTPLHFTDESGKTTALERR